MKARQSEGEMNYERRWTLRNTLRVSEGREVGGWVSPVMGIKSTDCTEHP